MSLKLPFTVLADIPAQALKICGDMDGGVWQVTDEMLADIGPQSIKGNAVQVASGAVVYVPWAERHSGGYETVELQRRVIADRWSIVCGFSERAQKWFVLAGSFKERECMLLGLPVFEVDADDPLNDMGPDSIKFGPPLI